MAMERNPDVFKDRVDWLIDHEEERKRDQKTWMLNHVLIVGYLRGACRYDMLFFPDAELVQIYWILIRNPFLE